MKKVVVAILLFVVAFAIPVGIYSLATKSSSFDIRNQAAESTESSSASMPQIVSVPITIAEVDQVYQYKVRAVDADSTELEYIVKEKPGWLDWNDEMKTFEGIPSTEDVGTASVQISVSDGKWLSTQRFQITVNGDESSIAPATTEESNNSEDVVAENSNENADASDLSEYGLAPISDTSSENEVSVENGAVLGASDEDLTQLPDTAVFNGVLVLSLGFSVLCVAAFLLLDARYGVVNRFTSWYAYSRGKQISLRLRDGSVVRRRRVSL